MSRTWSSTGRRSILGYEEIGEYFSNRTDWKLAQWEYRVPKVLSDITGEGLLLDLGCGDGNFTVPCASFGTRIIAADISNRMLSLLQKLARENGIPLECVDLCRMNAFALPLRDNSVDAAFANSMLHLISDPEKVIREIHRVLKPGGAYICLEDRPYRGVPEDVRLQNARYFEIESALYMRYWELLGQKGYREKKISPRFDRDGCCGKYFSKKEVLTLEGAGEWTQMGLNDITLPRLRGRGYSAQAGLPEDVHREALDRALMEIREKYGIDFDSAKAKILLQDYGAVTVYRK